MASIQESVQGYRATQVQEHQGLLSKLKIGNNIYDIKDPAVEQLATFVDNAIEDVQTQITKASNSWKPVTKGENAGKFATSVTQGAQGGIEVAYSNIRNAALTNSAANNKIITSLTQNVDGQVSYTVADLVASNVGSTAVTATNTSIGITATTVQGAIKELATGVQTAKSDAITAAETKINALAGTDWTAAAGTVKDIIDELTGADTDATQAMITIADKLRDDFTYTPEGGSQTTSVKGYIDGKIAGVQSQATGGISDLDAEVTSTDGTNVQVKVTEVDGKITAVNVTTDNSINAAVLANKVGEIGSQTVKAYVDEQIANKNVSASSSSTDYITAGAKNNAVTVAATQKLIDAVTAAEGSLAAAKVTKDNVAYCTSSTYTSNYEQLELTFATKDFVVPTSSWSNS